MPKTLVLTTQPLRLVSTLLLSLLCLFVVLIELHDDGFEGEQLSHIPSSMFLTVTIFYYIEQNTLFIYQQWPHLVMTLQPPGGATTDASPPCCDQLL